ncbi:MAG: 4Fe-4S binding protein [Candidatus Zixiibacteriota bacterium]|nr:MAG: 4Fe-4S binding protein [candidate division Zixibacteria bacterium]
MPVREIILIDEEKCDGCGLCIPSCPEGALAILDGKAKLISESYCDGMGACVGECPQDAMRVIKREAPEFDEAAANENMRKAEPGNKQSRASSSAPNFGGCPGSRTMVLEKKERRSDAPAGKLDYELTQWPVQLHLVSPLAPYFNNRELLIAADCVPFADPNFHHSLLKNKSLAIACPKLDDTSSYAPKLAEIIRRNNIPKITVVIMVVPCCMGLYAIVKEAVEMSGKNIEINSVVVGVDGEYRQGLF